MLDSLLQDIHHMMILLFHKAAGPESLVNYFQKGALLGKKVALNLWYVDTRMNSIVSFQYWIYTYLLFTTEKKDNWITFIKNITKRTKDLMSLFDPKVHLFENSLIKILAQLQWWWNIYIYTLTHQGGLKSYSIIFSHSSP